MNVTVVKVNLKKKAIWTTAVVGVRELASSQEKRKEITFSLLPLLLFEKKKKSWWYTSHRRVNIVAFLSPDYFQ